MFPAASWTDAACSAAPGRVLIDCRTNSIQPVPIAASRGRRRPLRAPPHAGRQRRTRRGGPSAKRSRGDSGSTLRDATLEQVADNPRARHVVTKNARALETARRSSRATSPHSVRCCPRVTPASATTTRCRLRSSTCSSASSSRAAPPVHGSPAPGSADASSRSRAVRRRRRARAVDHPLRRRDGPRRYRVPRDRRRRGADLTRAARATSARGAAPSSARTRPR